MTSAFSNKGIGSYTKAESAAQAIKADLAGRPLADLSTFEHNALALVGEYERRDAALVERTAELRMVQKMLDDVIYKVVRALVN